MTFYDYSLSVQLVSVCRINILQTCVRHIYTVVIIVTTVLGHLFLLFTQLQESTITRKHYYLKSSLLAVWHFLSICYLVTKNLSKYFVSVSWGHVVTKCLWYVLTWWIFFQFWLAIHFKRICSQKDSVFHIFYQNTH